MSEASIPNKMAQLNQLAGRLTDEQRARVARALTMLADEIAFFETLPGAERIIGLVQDLAQSCGTQSLAGLNATANILAALPECPHLATIVEPLISIASAVGLGR